MLTAHASPTAAASWLAARVRGSLRTDSRLVEPGDGFIAWPGHAHDARRYVSAALAAGAATCVVDAHGAEAFAFDDERISSLPDLKANAGALANAFFAQPSAVLDMVACTGTNGKTSTSWWTAQALCALGRRCGVVGTLGIGEPGAGPANGLHGTGLTTPDPVALHAALRGFVDEGFAACALEASSIGLVEGRLNATQISVAIFTNLTQDHLDYHGSMAAYGQSKRALFAWPGLKAAVINIDDAFGARLAAELKLEGTLDLWTVSCHAPARLRAQGLRYEQGGLTFEVTEDKTTLTVHSPLVGDFNASNLLCVLGGLRALGVPLLQAVAVMPQLSPVPGRMQTVDAGGGANVQVLVDYAHTPDAMDKALQALQPLVTARGGKLWCVFGCGGNRDAAKRPLMGGIAACGADHVVLTSDNPRDEKPADILAQILAGVTDRRNVVAIADRRQAIAHAVAAAAPGDVVLLAGKGHETTQEMAGVKRPFSDVDEARAALHVRVQRLLHPSMAAA
jgi:UDP-N-acetylmuramyl-tripeptide synthetase